MNVRVTISGTHHGNMVQNVVHFQRDNATEQEVQGLGPLIITDWINQIRGQQASAFKYTNIMVQPISPAFGQAFNTPIGIFGNVSDVNGAISFQSVILSLKTGVPGRTGRGRVYVGGIRSDSNNLNTLNPTRLLEWNQVSLALKARWGPGGTMPWRLVIIPRAEPSDHKFVIDIAVRSIFGVQRRRNTGVGI